VILAASAVFCARIPNLGAEFLDDDAEKVESEKISIDTAKTTAQQLFGRARGISSG
jgi:hypothetical protein